MNWRLEWNRIIFHNLVRGSIPSSAFNNRPAYKRPEFANGKGIVFHHDNARLYTWVIWSAAASKIHNLYFIKIIFH